MPKTSTAVDELGAIKERYEGKANADSPLKDSSDQEHRRIMFSPAYWRYLAVLLAVFSGVFLMLSYKQVLKIRDRENSLKYKEGILKDYEARASSLSAEIGTLTAKSNQMNDELVALKSEVANVSEVKAQYIKMVNEQASLKEEKDRLTERLLTLNTEEGKLNAKLPTLQSEKLTIENIVKQANESLKTLQDARSSEQIQLSELDKTIKNSLSDSRAKQVGVAKISADLEGLTRQLELKQSELASLNTNYETMRGKLEQLEKQKSELSVNVGEAEKQLLLTRGRLKDEDMLLSQRKAEIQQQETELTQKRADIAILEKKRIQLEQNIGQLQGKQRVLEAKEGTGKVGVNQ